MDEFQTLYPLTEAVVGGTGFCPVKLIGIYISGRMGYPMRCTVHVLGGGGGVRCCDRPSRCGQVRRRMSVNGHIVSVLAVGMSTGVSQIDHLFGLQKQGWQSCGSLDR